MLNGNGYENRELALFKCPVDGYTYVDLKMFEFNCPVCHNHMEIKEGNGR